MLHSGPIPCCFSVRASGQEGREKGDIVLSAFVTSQCLPDSSLPTYQEDWPENANSAPLNPSPVWNLISFHITSTAQEQFCKKFRGRWDSDWHGWEQAPICFNQKSSSTLSIVPSQQLCHGAAPNLRKLPDEYFRKTYSSSWLNAFHKWETSNSKQTFNQTILGYLYL